MMYRRKAFSLTELMVSVLIAAPIVGSLIAALMFTMRAQATYGEQTMIRHKTDFIIQRLVADIRNTSASSYNSEAWQFAQPALQGGLVEGEDPEDEMVLRLFDAANGRNITWTYDRTDNFITRQTQDLSVENALAVQTDYEKLSFSDLNFVEVPLSEYQSDGSGSGIEAGEDGLDYQGTWENIDDESQLTNERVTAIRILGRSLSNVSAKNSLSMEVDGNEDGDLRDDAVGARFFNRENQGDNPAWQYIYNVEVAFRNS